MKVVTAVNNQTLYDIALQEMGSIEGVFDILIENPFLRLDMAMSAGTKVLVPEKVISAQVVDYLERNNIKPIRGLGEQITINLEDMINITQSPRYNLSLGARIFDGVRLWNLVEKLSVQINYSGISSDKVIVALEQSLDGLQYDTIQGASSILDKNADSHTFNLLGILTNYVRLRVDPGEATTGMINEIIFRV
jgi:hypothetical protein